MTTDRWARLEQLTRSGGGVALFWDVRDTDRSALLDEYHHLLRDLRADASLYLEAQNASEAAETLLRGAAGFTDVARYDVPHEWRMHADDFSELSLMAGFVRAFGPRKHHAFRQALDTIIRRHADAATNTITIPYRTSVWTARRSTT